MHRIALHRIASLLIVQRIQCVICKLSLFRLYFRVGVLLWSSCCRQRFPSVRLCESVDAIAHCGRADGLRWVDWGHPYWRMHTVLLSVLYS
jgi:hypothetical protein